MQVFDADTHIKNNAFQLPWDIAAKPDTGIMSVIAMKDPKEVLYSLFAVGAAGSEAANRVDFQNQQVFSQLIIDFFKKVHFYFFKDKPFAISQKNQSLS